MGGVDYFSHDFNLQGQRLTNPTEVLRWDYDCRTDYGSYYTYGLATRP